MAIILQHFHYNHNVYFKHLFILTHHFILIFRFFSRLFLPNFRSSFELFCSEFLAVEEV